MTVFRAGGEIFHNEGARLVWSTTRRPMLLLPESRVVIPSLDVAWPDLAKANAYGFNSTVSGGLDRYNAASYITVVPQNWDSGLSPVATIPAGCNYFQVDFRFSRIDPPDAWLGTTIPMLLADGVWQTFDGGSAAAERIGPLVRIFRFERVGNTIYLRTKQSVINAGERFAWLPGNSPTFPGGAQRNGWTWGGTGGNLGHACSLRATTTAANSNRGQSNMAPVNDNTDYSSTWRATVIITPGYIKP